MIDRRQLLIKAAGSALLINAAAEASAFAASTSGERFEVTLSDAEWRKRLTPEQYAVLRDQSTERAGTSPLDREKRKGVFVCAGCNLDLYRSEDKFDSGTGWPSFVRPIKNAVRTSIDRSLFSVRIEVHCRRCGGHLGHVFDDGPAPTGKRYCMNGIAMKFRPV
jgi:peptide-methionine (R)-S-oxide reductase